MALRSELAPSKQAFMELLLEPRGRIVQKVLAGETIGIQGDLVELLVDDMNASRYFLSATFCFLVGQLNSDKSARPSLWEGAVIVKSHKTPSHLISPPWHSSSNTPWDKAVIALSFTGKPLSKTGCVQIFFVTGQLQRHKEMMDDYFSYQKIKKTNMINDLIFFF